MARILSNSLTRLLCSHKVVVTLDCKYSAALSTIHLCFDSTAVSQLMHCLNVRLDPNVPSIRPWHLLKPASVLGRKNPI